MPRGRRRMKIEQPVEADSDMLSKQVEEETISAINEIDAEKSVKADAPPAEVRIEDMPLKTLADYVRYNRRARAMNHKLRLLRYPIKQCPVELHPTERVIFGRNDQPSNPLPVYLSNELIHFEKVLYPGEAYDLPRCIVDYLAKKGTPITQKIEKPNGTFEVREIGFEHRFNLRTVYKD